MVVVDLATSQVVAQEPGADKDTTFLEDLPALSAALIAASVDDVPSCESPTTDDSGSWVRVPRSCEEADTLQESSNKRVAFTDSVDTNSPAAKGKLWTALIGTFSGGARPAIADNNEGQQVAQLASPADAEMARPHKPCFSQPLIGTGEVPMPTALKGILDAEPPQWMPDSSAFACMQCGEPFRPLSCGRHHCRFCGGLFCHSCSSARCLLPVRFRCRDPQRVCDSCYERLEPVQSALVTTVSYASQVATHDVTDMSCMRGWLNSPVGLSMQQEIYKATNTLRHYTQQVAPNACTQCLLPTRSVDIPCMSSHMVVNRHPH